jgi:choline dehydrogenase-like flavoprotein
MTREYDAIVVGSGASGSFAAKELTERGLDVALIEAGRAITPEDFAHPPKGPVQKGVQLFKRAIATLEGRPVQAKVAMYGHQFRHLFVKDFAHPYKTTRENPYLWIRGKQLGGRLHTYGRVLMRWSDTDFRAGSMDGLSPDWPIDYAALAPSYDHVETFLGLCGTAEGIPNLPDGKYLKPSHLTTPETRMKVAVEGRWPGRKVIPWRYMPPNAKRVPQPILAAQATGRLTVLTDRVVRKVLTDASGKRATGVETVSAATKSVEEVRARVVVLCCSPIETVRLMLNSGSTVHPDGLGNSSGTLGRYFMDQVPILIAGSIPGMEGQEDDPTWPADPFYGRTGGAYVPRWQNVGGRTEDFARGYGFQGTAGRLYVKPGRQAQFAFMGFGELLPNSENRVTLSARRDRWGMPVPHVRAWIGESERRMLDHARSEARAMAEAAGFSPEWLGSPLGLEEFGRGAYPDEDPISRMIFRLFFRQSMTMGAAIHESGGARMGDDPKTSVLNGHNQSWDVPNLFVTDASAFPTGGTAGTTLTIMALTVRAAAFISGEMQAGRL